jgi:hypothetical protein
MTSKSWAKRYLALLLQEQRRRADLARVRSLAWLRRARVLPALVAAGAVLAASPLASAESSGQAEAKARTVLAQVQHLQAQVRAAEKAYDEALNGVAESVTAVVQDGQVSDQLALAAEAARQQLGDRARGLYMSGGPLAIYATILDAENPVALQDQAFVVNQVMGADRVTLNAVRAVSAEASARVRTDQRRASRHIRTERSVAAAAARVQALLAQEQTLLAQARSHAADVRHAEQVLAAQRAAVATITADRIAGLHLLPGSPEYMALYRSAATLCPGLSWSVLAAVGQVESGHGRDISTSYAGAMGPMQFLPATFSSYAVDGNHDGKANILDPRDAIPTAARYLCANGAGGDAAALYRAIWHYNHADWYVQMVLTLARQYAA